MTTSVEIECKKICVSRCLNVLFIGCGIQLFLLAIFLLFVNFSLFHPIKWLSSTLVLLFSFYTWIYILPLVSVIVLYVILAGNTYLAVTKYYPSRFLWLYAFGIKKLALGYIYATLGFLTSWLYSRYLCDEYKYFMFESSNEYYLNSRHMFLTWGGIYSGLYYFFKEKITSDSEIKFSVIQESKYVQVRSALYKNLYLCLLKSFLPTISFTLIYWLIGGYINSYISYIFAAEDDKILSSGFSFISNIKLVFYSWILSSQILSNMYLLDSLFSVMLTQPINFSIEKDRITQSVVGITLAEALSLSKVPIIQKLACLDLFHIIDSNNLGKRQKLFALSFPGGHPYNWNQLCGQCLILINKYTEDLADSVKKISTVKCDDYYRTIKPMATETAEKILLRQYNEQHEIRPLLQRRRQNYEQMDNQLNQKSKSVNDAFNEIQKNWDNIKKATFKSIPFLFYFWGESEGSKTAYMLSISQNIIWISQGLAGLCAVSLKEDKYGVVQSQLPNIIKSLLKLKMELDKLNNVNLNGKKMDQNYIALKNAVKRSLFKIVTVFSEYLQDLINDPEDLKNLKSFMYYEDN